MKEVLYKMMSVISLLHDKIMRLNRMSNHRLSDKELHFLVVGVLGMVMVCVIYPLFRWLAEKKMIMAITWIYVMTCLTGLCFAIEIGQKITRTGNMEFADIVFGLGGFLVMFFVFAVLYGIYSILRSLIRRWMGRKEDYDTTVRNI